MHLNCIPKNQDNFPRSDIFNLLFSLVLIELNYASVFEAINISSTHKKMMDI